MLGREVAHLLPAHRRVDPAGAQRVDAHAARPVGLRGRARERDHAGLAGGVARHAGAGIEGRHRGDVDDRAAALRDHGRQHRALAAHGAAKVDLVQPPPVLVVDVGRVVVAHDAGAVHEHVDATEGRDHRGHGRAHGGVVGHVAVERGAVAHRLRPRPAGDGDARALAREARGHRRADAARGADDEAGLALQASAAHACSAKKGLSGRVEPPSTTRVCPVI